MTKRPYMLVYHPRLGDRETVKEFLDSRPEITYWYSCFPNVFFLISSISARKLASLFREFMGESGRFIIAHVNDDRQGWLPPKAWECLHMHEESDSDSKGK